MSPTEGLELKEYLKEVKPQQKLGFLLDDIVTGAEAQELYDKAKPFDQSGLYSGGYKPKPYKSADESKESEYKPKHKDKKQEQQKQPPEFKIPKLKPAPSAPGPARYLPDLPGNEYLPVKDDASFEQRVANYSAHYGKELIGHLQGQGRDFYKLERVGTMPTKPGRVALVAKVGNSAALIGSTRFNEEVDGFAQAYGVPRHLAERYIFDHEYTHLSQPPLDTITAELDVENTLKNFYLSKAKENPAQSKEYLTLASVPMMREHQVTGIYSKSASKSAYSKAA